MKDQSFDYRPDLQISIDAFKILELINNNLQVNNHSVLETFSRNVIEVEISFDMAFYQQSFHYAMELLVKLGWKEIFFHLDREDGHVGTASIGFIGTLARDLPYDQIYKGYEKASKETLNGRGYLVYEVTQEMFKILNMMKGIEVSQFLPPRNGELQVKHGGMTFQIDITRIN